MKKILLLTNCNSDNCGDMVIENCDLSLIAAVMDNLDLHDYEIISRDASIIMKYIKTKEESYKQPVEELIRSCDMVIFGGAPMFNYRYQSFYERTAVICEIAQKYSKPVIFSSIGIDSYDEDDPRCQRVKKAVNLDCVKMITTRDGFEELKQYKNRSSLPIAKVSDPAVFSRLIFRKFLKPAKEKKKIGIFVFRSGGFKDNGIDFGRGKMIELYCQIAEELSRRGYDYTFLTSGHCADELLLDYMVRREYIPLEKCLFHINSPERLIGEISGFDAVISCRLHPSIISYSLGVPSIGFIWNSKVSGFYESCGYPDRMYEVTDIDAVNVVDKVESMIAEGVIQDRDYLMSVYRYLFKGIKTALGLLDEEKKPWEYEELSRCIPVYESVSPEEQEKREIQKFRRTYRSLQNAYIQIEQQNKELRKLTCNPGNLFFHSGYYKRDLKPAENWEKLEDGTMTRLPSKALECKVKNPEACTHFPESLYQCEKVFVGWMLRFRILNQWFWCCEGDSYCVSEKWKAGKNAPIRVFSPGERIPVLPFIGVESAVAEARWVREGEEYRQDSREGLIHKIMRIGRRFRR